MIQREAPVVAAVCRYLDLHRIPWQRVHRIRLVGKQGKLLAARTPENKRGWPDIIAYPPLSPDMAIECKSTKGKASANQLVFRDWWLEGGRNYVLARPENWKEEIERVLQDWATFGLVGACR